MALVASGSNYDEFAWFYNRYWGNSFSKDARVALEGLVLPHLPAGGRILDLCCGTGQLSHWLTGCGFRVTGLDHAVEMLRFALLNAPRARFVAADARAFCMPPCQDAVVSIFDSLNHIPSREGLQEVFHRVHAALRPGGCFFFDMNMDEGFRATSPQTTAIVRQNHTCTVQSKYDAARGMGTSEVTLFQRRKDCWKRTDLKITEFLYPEEEIRTALALAGFQDIAAYDAEKDLGIPRGIGRLFFRTVKKQLEGETAGWNVKERN